MRKIVLLSTSMVFLASAGPCLAAEAKVTVQPASAILNADAEVAPLSGWRPIVSGRLKNGVRFAILPRTGHEPGVGILMRNDGGFIAERRPGERGLAHLIEHIAFLSPTSSAPYDRDHLRRLGLPLSLPAPSAGTTSWDETNYFFSTKTTKTTDVNELLGLLREVASDLTFRPDAVDEARTQVVQEMADKKLGNDIYANYIAAVAPGSPTDVIDAQNSDDVPTASVETIRALYHRLYRPENMMIVIVGDVDAVQMKSLIRQHFGAWRSADLAPVRPAIPVFHSDQIAPISYSAMLQGRRIAMMTVATRLAPIPPSRTRQTEAVLMDMLEVQAVNNRLAHAQPDGPPGKVGAWIEHGEQGHRLITLWDNFTADQWQPAVAGLTKASCELDNVGFSETEWAVAKRDVINDLDQRSRGMGDVANVELAKDLSHALAAGKDMIPPDELLRQARSWFPTIGIQAGNAWWHRQWNAGPEHIRVEAPELAKVQHPELAIRNTADTADEDARCQVRR